MNKNKNTNQLISPIQSYIDMNREKIDESLVSLRLMKEIDIYLDTHNISNKLLANDLGYSESFISQLMSGVKKINTSFINKFEKKYNVYFNFSIIVEKKEANIFSVPSNAFVTFNSSNNVAKKITESQILSYREHKEYFEYEEIEDVFIK